MTRGYRNPVHPGPFPDPGVLEVDGTWYAYGTNGPDGNVPLLASTDLVHWQRCGDVLPRLGRWARPGRTWAPEVLRSGAGWYVLYYTARSARHGVQCIGRAVAATPRGPFLDDADGPLVAQVDAGGSIDASPFRDATGAYLYWKNDGNAIGAPTHLWGQRLSADGLTLLDGPVRLLGDRARWHGGVVEAPFLYARGGRYYLFYSGNAFDSDRYAVGYARCDTPLGPCHDAPENPVLRTAAAAAGPGHCSVVDGPDGGSWMLYHAWPPGAVGAAAPGRQLWLSQVRWVGDRPVVDGPALERPAPRPTTGEARRS
jgi:beta-xylosidase